MQLTEDERRVLERYRQAIVADLADTATSDQIRDYHNAAYVLADALLRLFPVRTYGDIVIRWDDEITPERLVACGWKESDNSHWIECGSWEFWPYCPREYRYKGDQVRYPFEPETMLDVWQLMERCGIEEGGK